MWNTQSREGVECEGEDADRYAGPEAGRAHGGIKGAAQTATLLLLL